MYKVDIEMSEKYIQYAYKLFGIDPQESQEAEAEPFRVVTIDDNNAEEVLRMTPHLLDMISEKKVISIKITEQ